MDYTKYIFKKCDNFDVTILDDDTILLPKQSTSETLPENAIILNSIGADIYNCIDDEQTNIDKIIENIKSKYYVEEITLIDDILEFIAVLEKQKVIRIEKSN